MGKSLSKSGVVCLSYHYPPFGGVAVQRMLRFTRYLREQDFNTWVVCAKPPRATSIPLDPQLVEEIPEEVEVTRLSSFEPECYTNSWSRPWDKIRRNLFKTFAGLLVPDDQAFWIEQAARAAARLAQKNQAQVLLATGPPFSSLMAGVRAGELCGLPVVLDFRDDWTGVRARQGMLAPARQAREEKLERYVLQRARAVITVTPTLVDELKARSPHPDRIQLLPNGFDPEHFPHPASGPGDGVVFSAGSLYQKREPDGFFQAWQAFRQACPESSLRFELAGPVAQDCRHYFERSPSDCAWVGFLPHQQVRERLQQAALNLAWLDPVLSGQALTGKLLEYLGARRPVLLLGPSQSAAAQLLESSGLGFTLEVGDVEGIVRALQRLDQGDWPCQPEDQVIKPYDIREQVAQLAQILRQAMAAR